MNTSLFLAQVMGLSFAVTGVGILFNLKRIKKLVGEFLKSPALIYITGYFLLILGSLVVFSHNIWDGNLEILVTLIGWLVLLKGAAFLLFPKWVISMNKSMKASENLYAGAAVVMIALGLYLLYAGLGIAV